MLAFILLKDYYMIDECLDKGGCWDYNKGKCNYHKSCN